MHNEFNFSVDRGRVINSINSYWKLPSPEILEDSFNRLLKELRVLSKPMAVFKFLEKPGDYNFNFLEKCSFMFFCVLTLGDSSTNRVEELFNQGKMFDGILLDAMASVLMFEYINQLQERIVLEARNRNMGLTCRICPGDGEIPIEYQGNILDRIGDTKKFGIHISNGHLLNPAKSMSFVYGADSGIDIKDGGSGCGECLNKYCSMRKS